MSLISNLSLEEFSKLCRLCLDTCLETDKSNTTDIKLILQCTSIVIDINGRDSLPNVVCRNCTSIIKSMNEFRIQWMENQQLLWKWLEDNSQKKIIISKVKEEEQLDLKKNQVFVKEEENISKDSTESEVLSQSTKTGENNLLEDYSKAELNENEYECASTLANNSKQSIEALCEGNDEMADNDPLTDHTKTDLSEDQYQCDICPKKFDSERSLDRHKIYHRPRKRKSALKNNSTEALCEGNEYTKTDLSEHQFECNVCPKKFDSERSLYKHERYHRPRRKRKSAPAENSLLEGHKIQYICDVCDKSFDSERSLYKHKVYKHKIYRKLKSPLVNNSKPPSTLLCETCDELIAKPLFEEHTNRHLNNLPYRCEICQKEFYSARSLRQHLITHDERHRVNVRKKRRNPTALQMKMIYQRNLRACEICGKRIEKYRFEDHINQHLDKRPYICDHCNKSFFSMYMLRRHMTDHRERNLECNVCNRKFNVQKTLYNHQLTHLNKKYKCHICNKIYSSR